MQNKRIQNKPSSLYIIPDSRTTLPVVRIQLTTHNSPLPHLFQSVRIAVISLFEIVGND